MLARVLIIGLLQCVLWSKPKAALPKPPAKPPVYKQLKKVKGKKAMVKWGAQRDLNP